MSHGPATILYLHPSAELYGADRTLLQLVRGLDPARWRALVALPRRGPLVAALEEAGATVCIGELGIGARADLTPRGLLALAWRVPRGALFVRRLVRRHRAALVHTNTMIVLGGALGARWSSARHLWHVHEILERPAWLARAYARLFAWLADEVVSNSAATAASFERWYAPLADKQRVILNGVDRERLGPEAADPGALRAELGLAEQTPLVLLAGRINSWKGQGLLVESLGLLKDRHPDLRVLFAGEAPAGQEHFERDLDQAIERAGVAERVLRIPFRDDVASLYAAADLCVVPSTRPEPFGLVAAEAMALGRAVIAADHGGLPEVVVHGETGLLVSPNDAPALAEALDALLRDPDRAASMGAAGRRRQQHQFCVARYVGEFVQRYEAHDPRPEPTPGAPKIVHLVLGKANPARANGVNRVVHNLAAAQLRAGLRAEVWGITPTPNAPTGERPYRLRCFKARRWRLPLAPELVHAIRSTGEPTVFHLHGGLLPELAAAARLITRAGQRYVFTPHGTYLREALGRRPLLKRIVMALFDRRLIDGAGALQVFSAREAADVARVAPRARIVIIPNGQDPLEVSQPARLGMPAPVFGFLGRLTAHTKGLDVLLEAFAGYAAANPGSLVLVGDGPDRPALEAQALRLGVADRVRFLGAQYGDEKLATVAAYDAFVHPSRHEGLPGAVLEAAALGLPLIITAGTNLTQDVLAEAAGLTLPDTEVVSLTAALQRFVAADDGTRCAWSDGARRMIDRRFTWRRVEQQLAAELYDLAPIRQPGPEPDATADPTPAPALPASESLLERRP